MRLWTLHPRYLDAKGLVAAWREALLAQKVLGGATKGYTRHPQLARFRSHPRPVEAMAAFLTGIAEEAERRGYHFDTSKISGRKLNSQIEETKGQLLYEWAHLKAKLRTRAPEAYRCFMKVKTPKAHALFHIVPGDIREWERTLTGELGSHVKYPAFFTPFIRKRRRGTAYPALAKSLGMTRSSLLIGEWAADHFD